ncbi:MAG: hypothetical protein ACXV7E_05115 [Methylobacter sp.]
MADLLTAEEKAATKTFKTYEPGLVHIDSAQINLGKDKWYLLVAIDRATRYVYLKLHDNKTALLNQYSLYLFKLY